MIDRSWVSEYPNPFFTLKQFSSYDQNSVAPDQEGWFANHDASWFIRTDSIMGRREFVLFDADGPGAIVRFWMTFGNEAAYTGTMRFYLDGSEKPEIEGSALDIISGGLLTGEPLSSSVSPETNYYQRGHNLYLPIPYAQNLKVTYECEALNPENHSPSVYYNISYRTYQDGVKIKSFSLAQLESASQQINKVNETLKLSGHERIQVDNYRLHSQEGALEPGKRFNLSISGKNAIQKIQLKLEAGNMPQALRSTVIEITFDGEKTVWAPVGEFFGTGYQIYPSQTWYTEVSEEGTMACFWLMPFESSAEVNLYNYGNQTVHIIEQKVWTDSYKWTNQSMHFGAIWQELREVESGGSSYVNGDDGHFDVNYVTLKGEGVYMGSTLTIFNTADAWWGEGDEKIWVDGESFPSFIGTGTEDYFGYAWCRPEKFSHFLIAQPTGAGNFHPGMSVNLRYHILDGIPFAKSLKFDLELWHWAKTVINYAPMSFWYLKPGGKCNLEPNIDAVKEIVSLKRDDLVDAKPVSNGILEGEDLRVKEISNGSYQIQTIKLWDWSQDSQLWWIADKDHAIMTADFLIEEDGLYQINLTYSKAIDYGNFRVSINGNPYGKTLVGYHDQTGKEVITANANLGQVELIKGENTITFMIDGQHKDAVERYMLGIDQLQFRKL